MNGEPDTTPLASKSVVVTPAAMNRQGYSDFQFDAPVPVSGVFYVGFGQAYTTRFIPYGVDLNTKLPAGSLWFNTSSAWDTARARISGAFMMRVVMNNNSTSLATPASNAAGSFALYPNPGHGTVRVSGPAFRSATVLDALGRPVWEQPAPDAGRPELPLGQLPPGLYLVRLALPDGSLVHRRLVLE